MKLTREERDSYAANNLRLVPYALKTMHCNYRLSYDDLLGAGNLGFAKALLTFDTEKGFEFSTYAIACIKNEIYALFRKERRYLENELLTSAGGDTSDSNANDGDFVLSNITDDTVENNPEDNCVLSAELQTMDKCLNILPEKFRVCLQFRFNLKGNKFMTQQALAEYLGISQSAVCRLEQEALRRMNRLMTVYSMAVKQKVAN